MEWAGEVHRQMVDPKVKAKPKREYGDKHDEAVRWLANMLIFLGFHERAVELADEALAGTWKTEYDGLPRFTILMEREKARAILGTVDEASVARLEGELAKARKSKFFNPRYEAIASLTLAMMLDSLGKPDEAEARLATVRREESGEPIWQDVELFRICREIREGRLDGLEQRLEGLLEEQRKNQSKIAEISVISLYSDLCLAEGRPMEGLMAEREALRLIRAFDLYPLEPRCLARIAVLQARAGDPDGAAEVAARSRELLAS